MSSYTPFPITEFKSGLSTYAQPWMRPADAFEPLNNAYIYRGALQKRQGYEKLGKPLPGQGRMFYTDYLEMGDGTTGPFTGTITPNPITVGTLTFTDGTETLTSDETATTGYILAPAKTITGATQANPCKITTSGVHGYTSGDAVQISEVVGMTELNILTLYVVTVTSTTEFTLDGIDSTAFDMYTSGGLVKKAMGVITWATGAYSIEFTSTVSATTPIYASYGYTQDRPIMALKQWVDSTTDTSKLVAFDTRRACVFNNSTEQFDPINSGLASITIPENTTGSGIPTTLTITTGFTDLVPTTLSMTDNPNSGTVTDSAGAGTFGTGGNFTPASTVVYSTGVITLNYLQPAGDRQKSIEVTFNIQDDYFTGTFTNFFNTVNWNAPSSFITNTDNLYITNNIDQITLYNGTHLSRPPFPTVFANIASGVNDIQTCLDLQVYKNRLLVIRPTARAAIGGAFTVEGPTIRFSQIFKPTNLAADIAGNGGSEEAPTSDFIYATDFLRDQLIVFFKNSTRHFQFTGLTNQPFRWATLNTSRSTNCPYSTVSYDERVTSVGQKGFIACDGVNVQRYDMEVIDEWLNIDANHLNQVYSQRFDTINQTWTLYPDQTMTSGQQTGRSNKATIYNFLENTWAVYDLYMSCLGLFYVISDKAWEYFPTTSWTQSEVPWNNYLLQGLQPNLLSGGHNGTVYILDSGNNDDGAGIACNIKSTILNPNFKTGRMVEFGYMDLYYLTDDTVTLTIDFFLNGSEMPTGQRQIVFAPVSTGQPSQAYNFQRVYFDAVAQSIQFEITTDATQASTFKILGITLWAKQGGRLTPPSTFV